MRLSRFTAAATAVGLALGMTSVVGAPAFGALDPATLEDVRAPEVAEVAQEIAAVLDGADPTADEQEIAAALHEYLSESLFADDVLLDALGVVLAGAWTDPQMAALRRIYSEYAPEDVRPPAGGGTDRLSEGAISVVEAPGPTDSSTRLQGFVEPPPAPAGGGGSDYRP